MSTPNALIAGRYRLVKLLGSGGMGVVWEAWDERLERRVAVKQLRQQQGLTQAETELSNSRAMREARINARLHHRHAVSVFDVVQHDGQPCLIMQFVPSVPLSVLLREAGTLESPEAAQIGTQISSALAAAHQVGIVHRDVKPANILIADDGSALISDFGISHAMGDATLTETGMVHGTPAYLAPEVARGGEAGFASDVFSLGGTLYTTLEGAPPFGTDQNSIALLHRVAAGDFDPPRHSGPMTPVLLAMLSADPADRPSMATVTRLLSTMTASPAPSADTTIALDPQTTVARTVPVSSAPPPAEPTVEPAVEPAAEPEPTTTPRPRTPPRSAAVPESDKPTVVRGPRRRRTAPVAILALLAAAAVVAALLLVPRHADTTTAGTPADPSQTVGSASASTAATPAAEPSASASDTRAASPTRSSSPSITPTPTPTPSPTKSTRKPKPVSSKPTAAELAQAIGNYYALMPGNTDQAWSRMTASYQQNTAGGRRSYERFWGVIRRVSATKITGTPPDGATATITYTYTNGRVVRERTAFRLVNENGVLKINQSSVLSSA